MPRNISYVGVDLDARQVVSVARTPQSARRAREGAVYVLAGEHSPKLDGTILLAHDGTLKGRLARAIALESRQGIGLGWTFAAR